MASKNRRKRLLETAEALRNNAATQQQQQEQQDTSTTGRVLGAIGGVAAAGQHRNQVADALQRNSGQALMQHAAFDMEKYRQLAASMIGRQPFTASQQALMAHTPRADVMPFADAAPALYTQQAQFELQGATPVNPTYDDYVNSYFTARGGTGAGNLGIMQERDANGQPIFRQEEIDAITDPNRARPAQGSVSTLDLWTNKGGAYDAMTQAYAMQLNDQQGLTAYGVFDSPEHLVNGNIEMVGTDYLRMWRDALPEIISGQSDYWTRYEAAEQLIANATNMRMHPGVLQYYEDYDGDVGAVWEDYAASYASPEEYEADITAMIELDNLFNGTSYTLQDYYAMAPEVRNDHLTRMVNQYHDLSMGTRTTYDFMDDGDMYGNYPYETLLENIDAEIESREAMEPYIEGMMSDPDAMGYVDYVQPGDISVWDRFTGNAGGSELQMVTLAAAVNGDTATYESVQVMPWVGDHVSYLNQIDFSLMTEMERAIFNYYYNRGMMDDALGYYGTLENTLLIRTRNRDKMGWEYTSTADWLGASANWVMARGATIGNAIVAPIEMGMAALGAPESPVPNIMYDFSNTVTKEQSTALAGVGGPKILGQSWAQWLYGTGTNVTDMGLAIFLGGKLGPALGIAPETATLMLMSGEASAAQWGELAGQGMPAWEKIARSVGSGAVEYLTEKLPLEYITGKKGRGVVRWLMGAATEGAEEVISELSGYGLDAALSYIAGHKNEIQQRIDELALQGVQNPEEVVLGEVVMGTLQAGLGGVLAGGVMGGGAEALQTMQDARFGKPIAQSGNVQKLIELGLAMGEGTQSYQLAMELQAQLGQQAVQDDSTGEVTQEQQAEQQAEQVIDAVEEAVETEPVKTPTPGGVHQQGIEQVAKQDDSTGEVTQEKQTEQVTEAVEETAEAADEQQPTQGGVHQQGIEQVAKQDDSTGDVAQQSEGQTTEAAQEPSQKSKRRKISNAKLGQLYQALMTETAERYHKDVRDLTVDSVAEALEDKGSTYGRSLRDQLQGTGFGVRQLAEAIVDAEGDFSRIKGRMGKYIREHFASSEIAREFQAGSAEWTKRLREARTARDLQAVSALGAITALQGKHSEQPEVAPAAADVAAETDKVVATLTRRKKTREIFSRGIVYRVGDGTTAMADIVRIERDGDGYKLVINRDGAETAVTMDQVEQVNGSGVARVLAYAQGRVEITDTEINEMVGLLETTQTPSSDVIAAYEAAVNAGYMGSVKPVVDDLVLAGEAAKHGAGIEKAIELGYMRGVAQAAAAEQLRKEGARNARLRGEKGGNITYVGEIASSADVAKAKTHSSIRYLRRNVNLTAEQDAAVRALSQLAKAVGVNVALYMSKAGKGEQIEAPNGWYDNVTGTIYIDLNAGINQGGQALVKSAMMRVAGHELTHFLESRSVGGYSRLREMIREQIAAKGQSYMQLVLDKARTSTTATTREAAEAEVIADACEMMLTNTSAIRQLVSKDKGLVAQISQFVNRFMRRVRRAISGIGVSNTGSAVLTEMRDGVLTYAKGLQDAWDQALVEAAESLAEGMAEGVAQGTEAIAAEVEAALVEDTREVAEAIAEEIGESVTPEGIREAVTMDVAEAAAQSVAEHAQKMAETLGAESLTVIARQLAEKAAGNMEGSIRAAATAYANAVTIIAMSEIAADATQEQITTAINGAVETLNEMDRAADMTAEQIGQMVTVITEGITEQVQVMREAEMVDAAELEAETIAAVTEQVTETALAIYRGPQQTVQNGLMALAAKAAREAVDLYMWQSTVEAARGRIRAKESTEALREIAQGRPQRQFSMRGAVEKRADGLVAVHNLHGEELLKTLRLGGFPMPSIAVLMATQLHSEYGKYSIVFGRETIDPEDSPKNRLYGGDAWTPTFPAIDTQLDIDAVYEMDRTMSDTVAAVDSYMANQVHAYFSRLKEGNEWISESRERLLDAAWGNEGMLAAYMLETGRTFDIARGKEAVDRGYKPEFADLYDAIIQAMGTEIEKRMKPLELIQVYGERLSDADDLLQRLVEWANAGDRRAAISVANRVREAREYVKAGRDTQVLTRDVNDYAATRAKLQAAIDRADFAEWMSGKMQQYLGEEGIHTGTDPYTRSGGRKSFKQTHMAVTAENIVKAMMRQQESSTSATTAKGLMAAAAVRYGSIGELKSDAYRLGVISEEEYQQKIAQLDAMLEEFMAEIGATDYFEQEEAGDLLVQAAAKKLDAAGISKLFKKAGYSKAGIEAGRKAVKIIRMAQTMPTGYFEAKPYRVVGFDEVRMVVAPADIPGELAEELTRLGIPYTTYDGTDADRVAKVNAVEGVQFSERTKAGTDYSAERAKHSQYGIDWYSAYTRWTKSSGPMSRAGYAMFAQVFNPYTEVSRGSKFGDTLYIYYGAEAIEAWDDRFVTWIKDAFREDYEEGDLPLALTGFREELESDLEGALDWIAGGFNPHDIVDGADAYDDEDMVQWLWERVCEPHEIYAIITSDGAIVFDEELIERHEGITKDDANDDLLTYYNEQYDTIGGWGNNDRGPDTRSPFMFSERTPSKPAPSPAEVLAEMKPTEDMTQVERDLLARYQKLLQEKQAIADEIFGLIQEQKTATAKEDKIRIKNRMGVLKSRQRKVDQELFQAEKTGGYASLMARYRGMVQMYYTSDSVEEAATKIRERLSQIVERMKALRNQGGIIPADELEAALAQLVDKRQLNQAAKIIKKRWNTTMSLEEIKRRIVMLHALQMGSDKEHVTEFTDHLAEFVRDLYAYGGQMNETAQYRLDLIRDHLSGRLYIDPQMEQAIKSQIGSVAEYRRVVGSVLTEVRKTKPGEHGNADGLVEETPDWVKSTLFGDTDNPEDFVLQLYHIIRNAKESTVVSELNKDQDAMSMEMAALLEIAEGASLPVYATDRVKQIMDRLHTAWEHNTERTVALQDIISELKAAKYEAYILKREAMSDRTRLKKIIAYYGRLNEQDALARERDMLERNRAYLDTTVAEWYKQKELADERRTLLGNIRRKMGWMDTRIRKEQDKKAIPERLKPVIDEAIRIMLESNGILKVFRESQIKGMQRTYEALKTLHGMDVHQTFKPDEGDIVEVDLADQLEQLRERLTAYAQVKTGQMYGRGTTVAMMQETNAILKDISDLVSTLWNAIVSTNTIFFQGQEVQLSELAGRLADDLARREDYGVKAYTGEARELLNRMLRDGNLTPAYFFRLLDSPVLTDLNTEFWDAQLAHERLVEEAVEAVAKIQADTGYWRWKDTAPMTLTTWQEYLTKKGKHTLQITVGEAMSIYATWLREQHETPFVKSHHLQKGGFNLRTRRRIRKKGKDTVIEYDGTPHKIGEDEIAQIEAYLTPEMKEYVSRMVAYMSGPMAELGNEVSMRLFGIRKFTEDYYFPMRVQSAVLEQSSTKGDQPLDKTNRIAGMSPTKRRVDQASKPLEIGDFTQVVSEHIMQMILYNTYAIPIENLNKVLNQTYYEGEHIEPKDLGEGEEDTASLMTLRGLFAQKYGDGLARYLSTYIADLNGGVTRDPHGEGFMGKLIGLRNRSAVMASLSVAVQQPWAIIRACYVIDPKYFVGVLSKTDVKAVGGQWKQLLQYSGAAKVKERGGFDMTGRGGTARHIGGQIADNYGLWRTMQDFGKAVAEGRKGERWKRLVNVGTAAGQRFDWLLGKLPEMADKWAWARIWEAVKREVADTHKGMDPHSEEFLELAGKRFDEVANLTQVYDSTLVRSQNMRSKSTWMKMLTAFKAEPTLTANMLMDAARTKNPKLMVKAAAVFVVSQVITAAAKAVVTAGRDDDEEKPWLEKYLDALGNDLAGWSGALNPMALLPIVSDIMSMLDGYDVERADMASIADLLKEAQRVGSGYYDDKSPYLMVQNAGGALATFAGIPLKNIMRDLRTLWTDGKHIFTEQRALNGLSMMHDASANFVLLPDRDNAYYYNRLYNSMVKGDTDDVEALTEYLTITGKSEDDIAKGVKDIAKERFAAGETTEEEAKAFLLKNGLADDQRAAFEAVDRWQEGTENYSAYNSVHQGIAAHDHAAIKREVDTLKANGYLADKKTMKSVLNTKYRDQYRELYKSNRTEFANLQSALVTALVAVGYTRSEALDYLKGWLKD